MMVDIVRNRPFTSHDYAIECAAHRYPWSQAVLESCQTDAYWRFSLVHEQQSIGYLIAHHVLDEVTLMNVAVAPKWQGQGYGRQLVSHLIAQCRAAEILKIWLEVRVSNKPAIQLYDRLGFTQEGIRKGYYPTHEQPEDALVMQFML